MTDQHDNIIKTRKCSECESTDMTPCKRNFTGLESTILYKCPGCEATVEIKSLFHSGLFTLLAIFFFGLINVFWVDWNTSWGMGAILGYIVLALVIFLFPLAGMAPHYLNPVTGERLANKDDEILQGEAYIRGFNDVLQRFILRMESHGFLFGFFAPLVVIGIILGTASLLGFINHSYF